MRFWKCEFCQKWDFVNVNSVTNEIFKMWIFGLIADFCPSVDCRGCLTRLNEVVPHAEKWNEAEWKNERKVLKAWGWDFLKRSGSRRTASDLGPMNGAKARGCQGHLYTWLIRVKVKQLAGLKEEKSPFPLFSGKKTTSSRTFDNGLFFGLYWQQGGGHLTTREGEPPSTLFWLFPGQLAGVVTAWH